MAYLPLFNQKPVFKYLNLSNIKTAGGFFKKKNFKYHLN